MALVLLQPGAAEAFVVECASPNPQRMLQGQAAHQAKKPGATLSVNSSIKPSIKKPSPQAAYAQEHGAGLKTCKVLVGRAKLGGQPGILITSIDTQQNKAWLFCRGVTGTNCLLRTAKPSEQATAWAKGSITRKRIGRGQFTYIIKREEASSFLSFYLAPTSHHTCTWIDALAGSYT